MPKKTGIYAGGRKGRKLTNKPPFLSLLGLARNKSSKKASSGEGELSLAVQIKMRVLKFL